MRQNGEIALIERGTDGDSSANESGLSDHDLTTLSDAEVNQLTPDELHAYFAACLAACEFKVSPRRLPPREYEDAPKGHKVYFLRGAGGAIKIGFTAQSMSKRLHCIQNGSPIKIEVLAVRNAPRECEQAYHRCFAAHRLHGEWFAPHPDLLAEIERLQTTRPR